MTIETVAEGFTGIAAEDFEVMARTVRTYQKTHNPVLTRYPAEHPYLPVAAFKHAALTCFPPEEAERVFVSSGTGSGLRSRHFVRSLALYERAVRVHFEAVFGPGPFTLVGHLPHYADSGQASSLVTMVDCLIRTFGDAHSGFFLDDVTVLDRAIAHSAATDTPLLLFGAAFGLLTLLEKHPRRLPAGARIIETGGMKTHRQETTREDLHHRLAKGFGIAMAQVWSEYGMCELMSQAYAQGGPVYTPPPWMRVRVVDPAQPAYEMPEGEPGALAVFDLANCYSASAILTEDLAVRRGAGFEVWGRLPQSALRGCNFLFDGV